MAVLGEQDRAGVWSLLMSIWSDQRTEVGITKDQLRAAVDAADSWVDTNAASFNSALPLAARQGLTSKQKAWLLLYVVLRRFEVS
jgi:hypothetical protein